MNNTNNETAVPCLQTVNSTGTDSDKGVVLDWKETCDGLAFNAFYRTGCLSCSYNISSGISFGLDIDQGLDQGFDIWSVETMISDPSENYLHSRVFHTVESAKAYCLEHARSVLTMSKHIKN